MGCGKSKHAVATENTIGKSKSLNTDAFNTKAIRSTPSQNQNPPSDKKNGMVQEEYVSNLKPDTGGDHEHPEVDAPPDPKDITEHQELPVPLSLPDSLPILLEEGSRIEAQGETEQEREEEEEEEKKAVFLEEECGRGDEGSRKLISHDSPDHYFSSRKDDDALEGFVSEVESEYDSPRRADASKPTQEQPSGEVKGEEEEVAVVAAESAVSAANSNHKNPAPQT